MAKVEYMSLKAQLSKVIVESCHLKKLAYENNSGPKQPWLDAAGREENDTFLVTVLPLWYTLHSPWGDLMRSALKPVTKDN